ncbi:phosphatase PAP2 family protein [Mucilaginibacter antarcticus]|uniref:Phosphatase PAP2 family protein n=1 Tax=Mucilaginibacter antarcticus TaxID=1855725 RepID=A0ABW5XNU7_9SPHI
MKKLLAPLFLLLALQVNAQEITVDTTKKDLVDTIKKDLFTAPDTVPKLRSKALTFVPPILLIGYGAASFYVKPLRQLDYYVQTRVKDSKPTFHTVVDSYAQFSPVAAVYVLNLAGVTGKNRFLDRTILLGISSAIMGGSIRVVKNATHRLRPNGENSVSFPSGHTATAFMGAEFLAQEYSGKSVWYGVAGYTVAAGTGIFRVYNRDHWFSDIVAGAGFGILSVKAAYFIYPYMRDFLTAKGKNGKSAMIMPTYQDGVVGFNFALQL